MCVRVCVWVGVRTHTVYTHTGRLLNSRNVLLNTTVRVLQKHLGGGLIHDVKIGFFCALVLHFIEGSSI